MSAPQITTIARDELLGQAAQLKAQGLRFVQCCAVRMPEEGSFEVIYTFCDDATNEVSNLRVPVTVADELPSVGPLFPCAFMFENEMHDLFGINVVGITIDFKGGFYHLHIPTPMAIASERAAKKAAKTEE